MNANYTKSLSDWELKLISNNRIRERYVDESGITLTKRAVDFDPVFRKIVNVEAYVWQKINRMGSDFDPTFEKIDEYREIWHEIITPWFCDIQRHLEKRTMPEEIYNNILNMSREEIISALGERLN